MFFGQCCLDFSVEYFPGACMYVCSTVYTSLDSHHYVKNVYFQSGNSYRNHEGVKNSIETIFELVSFFKTLTFWTSFFGNKARHLFVKCFPSVWLVG